MNSTASRVVEYDVSQLKICTISAPDQRIDAFAGWNFAQKLADFGWFFSHLRLDCDNFLENRPRFIQTYPQASIICASNCIVYLRAALMMPFGTRAAYCYEIKT